MRLVLTLPPSLIEFTQPTGSGPYPYLLGADTLRMAARAGRSSGIGAGESSSISVQLDNSGNRAATIIGSPLRVLASLYDGDDLAFSGVIASVRHGRIIDLTIES
jgi:hypothetical protein